MALFWAIAFGGLGLRFGTLGSTGGAGSSPPASTAGQPIGLLLALTKAS